MQNEEFIVVGQLFDMERFTNAQFVLKKLGPNPIKVQWFQAFRINFSFDKNAMGAISW